MMTAYQMLRDHVFAIVAVVPGLPPNVTKTKSPFLVVAGMGSLHHLLACRAVGMLVVMLLASWTFWHLSKTEGRWLRGIAGVMLLLALWQIPGLAFVVNECTSSTPVWLWYLAGCWYL